MEHEMILLDADFKWVRTRLARKFNGGMAESECPIRNGEDAGEEPAAASSETSFHSDHAR